MKPNVLLVTGLLVLLSGCQTVFNPYDDAFQCPETDEGACTSIPSAYQRSLAGKNETDECKTCAEHQDGQAPKSVKTQSSADSKSLYQEKRLETFKALLEEDRPPIVVPPEVVRVLVMSYTGQENEMFGSRYIYFFASESSWLLSNGVEPEQGENR